MALIECDGHDIPINFASSYMDANGLALITCVDTSPVSINVK